MTTLSNQMEVVKGGLDGYEKQLYDTALNHFGANDKNMNLDTG